MIKLYKSENINYSLSFIMIRITLPGDLSVQTQEPSFSISLPPNQYLDLLSVDMRRSKEI